MLKLRCFSIGVFYILWLCAISAANENANFEIYSPLQGDTYNVGDTIFIRWDKDVFSLKQAVISFTNGKVRHVIHHEGIDSKSPQWGNFAWKIPDTISDTTIQQCYIQVADYENGQIRCKSGLFTIRIPDKQSTIFNIPTRPIYCRGDTIFVITMKKIGDAPLTQVRVLSSVEWLTVSVQPIAPDSIAITHSITGIPQKRSYSTISLTGDGFEPQTYKVNINPLLHPGDTMTLTTPSESDTVFSGSSMNVQWATNEQIVPAVNLSMSLFNGNHFLVTTAKRISINSPEWGSFQWEIPEQYRNLDSLQCIVEITGCGTNCKIRSNQIKIISSGLFTNQHKIVIMSNTALVSSFYDVSGRRLKQYNFSGAAGNNSTPFASGCYVFKHCKTIFAKK